MNNRDLVSHLEVTVSGYILSKKTQVKWNIGNVPEYLRYSLVAKYTIQLDAGIDILVCLKKQ